MANTARLVIDPVSRKISTKYDKIRLVQDDNNSTPVTFEMPRYVRGHDMSRCSTIEVHYDNISTDRKLKHSDVYVVTDIIVAPEDEETINFSWLVSRGATQIVGNVDFSLHFGCNENPDLEYAWHTTTYSGIVVLEGKNNTQSVVEKHPDLVASILEYVDKKISEFDAVDIAQETGDSTEAVMSQKATTEAIAGKVGKRLHNAERDYAYITKKKQGGDSLAEISREPRKFAIPAYGVSTDGNVGGDGYLSTEDPVNPYHAANKQWTEQQLAGKLDANQTQAYSVYCTSGGGAQAMRYLSPIGTAANSIPYYSLPTNAVQFPENANPTCTFGACDPIHPIQVANKRYVDTKIRDLQQGVYNALGYQYVTVEDTSTGDFSQIPEGAMPTAYFESLGDIVVYGHDGKVIENTAEVLSIHLLCEDGSEESLDPNSVPTFFEIPNGCTTIMLSLSIPEAGAGLMSHFEIKGKKIIYQVKVGG